ncbi:MAG: c-type cytochrome domain-containing protein, partial [Planctomycetota bacterium]|nr:c-type cytochrome domain-containing protein [Planctomycetota bacterium]
MSRVGLKRTRGPSFLNRVAREWSSNDPQKVGRTFCRLLLGELVLLWATLGGTSVQAEVDFDRDVRPILAEKCYACHGPDEAVRQAELRLDLRSSAIAPLPSGEVAIVPGNTDESELIRRIFSTHSGDRMPPETSQKPLTDRERQVLKEWIDSGAGYRLHWAFRPIDSPPVPAATFPEWQRNEVDAFVARRLSRSG